jgi:PAS domain S-box-containing protein
MKNDITSGKKKQEQTRLGQREARESQNEAAPSSIENLRDSNLSNEALSESEAQFRLLADAIPQLVWMARADGWIYWYNRRWYEFTGTTPEQMEGWGWKIVHAPETLGAVMDRWQQSIASAEPFEMIFPLRGADGLFRPFLTRIQPFKDAQGRVLRWFGTNTDVGELKRTEEALRASEERYRGIYQHAGTGIAISDLEGRFQSCNPAYETMLGYTEAELNDFAFADLVHPENRDTYIAEIRRLIAEDIPSFEITNHYLRKDGQPIWVHERVSVLRDAALCPTHVLALITDITERKEAEEREHLLMREINHRAMNMLAIVQSIARQTAATTPTEFVERFIQRLQGLSASQDILVNSSWRNVPLEALVRAQLEYFGDLLGQRILLSGPTIGITAAAAQAIGLALHELATNAVEFGALSNDTGSVIITWDIVDDSGATRFAMSWVEVGGPPVTKPTHLGFGSTVTGTFVKTSLDGEVETNFTDAGVIWRLTCPVSNVLQSRRSLPRRGRPI